MLVEACVVLAAACTGALGEVPEVPSQVAAGPRYWQIISTYIDPEGELGGGGRQYRPGASGRLRHYNFEKIRMLDAEALVLAARASIHFARREMGAVPEAEYQRQVEENFDLCLQYYPVLARENDDFEELVNVIRHLRGNEYFRTYLIRRTVPGLAPDSAFTAFFQEGLRVRRRIVLTELQTVFMYRDESPRVLEASMDALFKAVELALHDALAADPAVQAWESGEGRPFDPRVLAGPEAPALGGEAQAAYRKHMAEFDAIIRFLNKWTVPDNRREPDTREHARKHAERVCDAYALPARDELLALFESDAMPETPRG